MAMETAYCPECGAQLTNDRCDSCASSDEAAGTPTNLWIEPVTEEEAEPVDEEAEGAEPYFASTDPVIKVKAGRTVVLGGFSETSMSSLDVDPSATGRDPGDEALADAVRRELEEDATTTDLAITVAVRRGVVHLRGTVADLIDADNAEDVAGRVPGVREVREELRIEEL